MKKANQYRETIAPFILQRKWLPYLDLVGNKYDVDDIVDMYIIQPLRRMHKNQKNPYIIGSIRFSAGNSNYHVPPPPVHSDDDDHHHHSS